MTRCSTLFCGVHTTAVRTGADQKGCQSKPSANSRGAGPDPVLRSVWGCTSGVDGAVKLSAWREQAGHARPVATPTLQVKDVSRSLGRESPLRFASVDCQLDPRPRSSYPFEVNLSLQNGAGP